MIEVVYPGEAHFTPPGVGMIRMQFQPWHLGMIAVQPQQLGDWPDSEARDARASAFAREEHCWTFFDMAGNVVACFGFVRSHADYLTAWAVMSELGTARLAHVTRWCRAYIAGMPERRIDVTVRRGFANGHQWARLLGLGFEGWHYRFCPDGEDMAVYARVDGVPADRVAA